MEMRPASSTELPRIQRALYRFETYRFLFPARQDYDFDYSDDDSDNINVLDEKMKAQMLFLAASPPWENEQLGCIHESIWRLVAPAYNDLALHSIEWEGRRRPARDYGDACIEYLLSGGLKEINEISLCNTWAKRYDLLGYDQPHRPVRDFRGFLRKTFEYYEGYCLIKYPPTMGAHKDTYYPVGQDMTEQGPQRTWDWLIERWAEQPNFEARKRIVVVMETARLRACGYVFWDEERMVDLGWMNSTSMDWQNDVLDFVNNPPILHDSDEVGLRIVLYALSTRGLRGYWNGGVGHANLMWAERDAWLRPWMKAEET